MRLELYRFAFLFLVIAPFVALCDTVSARDCRSALRMPIPGVFLPLSARLPATKEWLIAPGDLVFERLEDPLMRDYYFTEEQVKVPWLQAQFGKTVRFFDYGSGFLISSKGHVVTAAHVLESIRNLIRLQPKAKDLLLIVNHRFVSLRGARVAFDGWAQTDRVDVAVLEIPALTGLPHFEISTRSPVTGEKLVTIGAPRFIGGQKVLSIGEILDTNRLQDNPELIKAGAFERGLIFSSLQTHTSSSGGVVLSLRDGKVIGVHTQSLKYLGNSPVSLISMAEPATRLMSFSKPLEE